MPMASVKQVKVLVRSTEEALSKLSRSDINYKFGIQLQVPTQGGLTLEQIKTRLRKLEEALGAFQDEAPCNFGLEVSHDSEFDKVVVDETNKIYETKAALSQKPELVVPADAK